MKRAKWIIAGFIAGVVAVGMIVFVKLISGTDKEDKYFTEAKKGDLEITVAGTGELITENSVDIRGPVIVRNYRFRLGSIKITDLVPEGTLVKKGDYIATLEKTAFDNKLKDELIELMNMEADLERKILDTAVVLQALRDDIINQKYVVSEAGVKVEQSRYEPPATIRMAELDLGRSERILDQKLRSYMLKRAQIIKEIQNQQYYINRQEREVKTYEDVIEGLTVRSPGNGMVIYRRDRLGAKIKTGSSLWPYDLVVATLPDLSVMHSKIYVSEIEIGRVKEGQPVDITVDALRDRTFRGKVISIARIGEFLPNSDTRVFEVQIRLDGSDSALRPLMTTNNRIIISSFRDVIFVPVESLHAGADNIPFVYTRNRTRQIVIPGESDGKNVIIEQGLAEGVPVYLTIPENAGKFNVEGQELIAQLKEPDEVRKQKPDILETGRDFLAGARDNNGRFLADSLLKENESYTEGF
jgi:multidrug efflux pump subunit AcrA (membrane-fusion protein)